MRMPKAGGFWRRVHGREQSATKSADFERGFIRAEVIAFDDLKACGTLANAKAKGLLRSEGKEYIMHDGDVVNFLFNV